MEGHCWPQFLRPIVLHFISDHEGHLLDGCVSSDITPYRQHKLYHLIQQHLQNNNSVSLITQRNAFIPPSTDSTLPGKPKPQLEVSFQFIVSFTFERQTCVGLVRFSVLDSLWSNAQPRTLHRWGSPSPCSDLNPEKGS